MILRLPFSFPVSILVLVLALLASGCSAPTQRGESAAAPTRVFVQASDRVPLVIPAPAAAESAPVSTQQPVADGAPVDPAVAATPRLVVAPTTGSSAPGFTLPDLDGVEISLEGLRGNPVLLNFWATWWPYCRRERSALQEVYEQHADRGLVVLSVDIREPREVVQAYVREQGLTFPILLDETGDVAQQYRLRGVPTSFFIDRDGVIQGVHTGPLDASYLQTYLIRIP